MKRSNSKAPGLDEGPIPQQSAEPAPPGWAEVQKEIADASTITLLLVEGYQPPALAIAAGGDASLAIVAAP